MVTKANQKIDTVVREGFAPAQRMGWAGAYNGVNALMAGNADGKRMIPTMMTNSRGDFNARYMLSNNYAPHYLKKWYQFNKGTKRMKQPKTEDELQVGGGAIDSISPDFSTVIPDTSALPAEVQSGVVDTESDVTATDIINPRAKPELASEPVTIGNTSGTGVNSEGFRHRRTNK